MFDLVTSSALCLAYVPMTLAVFLEKNRQNDHGDFGYCSIINLISICSYLYIFFLKKGYCPSAIFFSLKNTLKLKAIEYGHPCITRGRSIVTTVTIVWLKTVVVHPCWFTYSNLKWFLPVFLFKYHKFFFFLLFHRCKCNMRPLYLSISNCSCSN